MRAAATLPSVRHCYRSLGNPPPPIRSQVPGVIGVSPKPEQTPHGGRDDGNEKNTTINQGEGENAGGCDTRGMLWNGAR